MRKRRTTTRRTKIMTVSAIQSTKCQIALILVSLLRLHFLTKVIPQTLINVILTVTFRLKNLLVRTVSTKNVNNISGDFIYSRCLLHTHACSYYFMSFYNNQLSDKAM